MKYLLTAFCAILMFSCSNDEPNDPPVPDTADRTVIIYISAENSLSSFATSNLNDMAEASRQLNNRQRLVVFFDDRNSSIMPYIAEVKNGEIVKDEHMVFSEDFYASDPEKMQEILSYIMEAYPAKSYALDLWGHASGWFVTNDTIAVNRNMAKPKHRAYGIDNGKNTSSNSGMWINIPTMAKVFSSLPHKFKFIFSDCCFFQCVESAYELKDCTEYIIASPSEVPGEGIAYREVIPLLFNTSGDFYKGIVDKWKEYTSNEEEGLPISVIKTSEAERFAQATSKIYPELLKHDDFGNRRLIYYGRFIDDNNRRARGYYDPMNIIYEYAPENPAFAEWKDALKALVPYSVSAERWIENTGVDFSSFDVNENTFSGISMFIPQPMYYDLTPSPNETIKDFKWAKAVDMK